MSHNQTGSQHRWLCSDGCCGNKGMEMLRNNAQEGFPEYKQCSVFINATCSRLYWHKARWHHAFMVFMTNSDPVNLTCCEVKDPRLHTFLLLLFLSHQFKWVWLFSSQQFIFKKNWKTNKHIIFGHRPLLDCLLYICLDVRLRYQRLCFTARRAFCLKQNTSRMMSIWTFTLSKHSNTFLQKLGNKIRETLVICSACVNFQLLPGYDEMTDW